MKIFYQNRENSYNESSVLINGYINLLNEIKTFADEQFYAERLYFG